MTPEHPRYSVVIATLGGQHLAATIECFQRSISPPAEILLCIPEAERGKVESLRSTPGVRVVVTPVRGQVAQRAIGFSQVQEDLVLQCDDDVEFSPEAIEHMLQVLLGLGRGHVVGPVYCHHHSRRPLSRHPTGWRGFLSNLYFSVVAGMPWGPRRMGRYAPTTCTVSVDPRQASGPIVQTAWLPGGFVLGYRDELVTENFYRIPGKAYGEDVIHSSLRSARGVKHHVLVDTSVYIEPYNPTPTAEELWRELRTRYAVSRRLGGNPVRAMLFLACEGARRLMRLSA